MNKLQKEKLAIKIYDVITPRLMEMSERSLKRNLNDAYMLAFQIGIIEDIKEVLK
jgi:hypothetical protein